MNLTTVLPARLPMIGAATCLALLAGCVTAPVSETETRAARSLREARSTSASPEARAGLYLEAAAIAAPRAESKVLAAPIYNAAAAELTALLRSDTTGRLWNHPLALSTDGSTYRLQFHPAQKPGIWSPDYFTKFEPASDVPNKIIRHPDRQTGIGGALVGVRKKTPREPFAPFVGITAPVTATLDFRGHDATLSLYDPTVQPNARVAGAMRPLAADFSAPLAYYPAINQTLVGLMGALRVSDHMSKEGLFMLQPYDPGRIPLIFVHGLISTPQMWRNVINEIETDPQLRGRFQYWVYGYPTGNPVVYSALLFRERLAKAQQLYGFPKGFLLVGHSLGGIVSRMQATTIHAEDWKRQMGAPAEKILHVLPTDGLVHRSIIFDANPNIRRIVFICTPHRGSEMATGGLGALAMRLIALPASVSGAFGHALGNSVATITGSPNRMPNSITSLSPKNPTLVLMSKLPIQAPHNTILGDRGRGDSPNSSDGVVPYWSSHLDSAQSEKIVPGPHSSCELPQTIDELKRILNLYLKTANARS